MNPHALQIFLPILILLPILYFRLSRMMKPQRLKLGGLWVRPAIMAVAAGVVLAAAPPPVASLAGFALAAVLGAGLGWYWGGLTKLHLHPEDGTLMSTGSQAGMIVLVLLLALRTGMRAGLGTEATVLHVNAAVLTDIFIIFTAALFAARGLEIFVRARRMMAASGLPSE